MGGQSPWSVKGVEPRTREAAKDLARREGLTLGELLNRLISETDEYQAKSGRPGQGAENAANFGHEASRLTAALEQLSRRLEAGGIELAASNGVTERLAPGGAADASPVGEPSSRRRRGGDTALGRVESQLESLRETQIVLSERVRRIEAHDPGHESIAALKSLEAALGRLSSQVFETGTRVTDIEKSTQDGFARIDANLGDVAQRLAATESLAQETTHRFADAMIDLSARLTGLESDSDAKAPVEGNNLPERLGHLEDLTTHAIEGANQGISLVNERVNQIEGLAQENANRMVEALVDLSARLTQLEGAGSTGDTLSTVQVLETRLSDMASRLGDLDARIETTRADIQGHVAHSLESGVEGRITEIAQALAARLDATEKRHHETFERINQKIADAAGALDARLAAIESGDAGQNQAQSMAMKLELASITRAVDERLASIERHDASVLEQAGQHIQRVAQSFGDRLEASERQSAENIATISRQMQELADRLAAKQEAALQSITSKLEGGDGVTRSMLDETMGMMRAEIQSVDARHQALTLPLQRDIAALSERLERAEQTHRPAFGEQMADPRFPVDIEPPRTGRPRNIEADGFVVEDGFGFDPELDPLASRPPADPFAQQAPKSQASAQPTAGRRTGFGSPFPDGEDGDGLADFADLHADVPDPLAAGKAPFDDTLVDMPLNPNAAGGRGSDDDFAILDHDWDEPNGQSLGTTPSYLLAARRAANQAAAREAALPQKKPGLLPLPSGRKDKKSGPKSAQGAGQQSATSKSKSGSAAKGKAAAAPQAAGDGKFGPIVGKFKVPQMTPVGMLAVAALAATGGLAVYNQIRSSADVSEKPAALQKAPEPLPAEALPPPQSPPADSAAAVANPQTPAVGPDGAPLPGAQPPTGGAAPAPVAPGPAAPTPSAAAVNGAGQPGQPAPAPPTGSEAKANFVAPPAQPPKAQSLPPPSKAAAPAPSSVAAVPAPKPVRPELTPRQQEAARIVAVAAAEARQARSRADAARPRIRPATFKAARPDVSAPRPVQRAAVASSPRPKPSVASPQARIATPRVASVSNQPAAIAAAAPRAPTVQAATPAAAQPNLAIPAVVSASSQAPSAGLYEQAMARSQVGDSAGSIALLRRAADAGDTRAMNRLAAKFENGDGVAKDLAQARALTERAAARGSRQAMHNLGVYYAQGDGVPQNMTRAAESFRRAAQRGVTDSQFNLGAMAEQGLGAPKSDLQAYYWYSIAARGGDPDAAAKAREVGARLTAEQRAQQDQLVAQFRVEPGSPD